MDTITHALLGAVTAQLGFRHKIGRDATWLATLAAVTPDLDIFIGPILSLTGAENGQMGHAPYHRGLTHSLLMTPVIALVIAAAWWWFRRRTADQDVHPAGGDMVTHPEVARQVQVRPPPRATPFLLLYACVFIAALTHPLLDFCTSYGTQLFAPLTNTRYAWDALPIVDIIYAFLDPRVRYS